MRTLRLPLAEQAYGPRVVLATLPGEAHALGLHMVALLLNADGCRVVMLGPDLPMEEIAGAAREQRADAVGISVSISSDPAVTGPMIETLRASLPADVALVVGGAGTPPLGPGAELLPTLDAVHAWARRLIAERRAATRDA
jgi:methanogenic corrinoid protein MtbC1